MVARTLVDHDILVGQRLVEELDREHIPTRAVMWFYLPDKSKFSLLVATPIVDDEGPLAAYGRIREVVDKIPEDLRPGPFDITAISAKDERVKALRKRIKTGKAISQIRLTGDLVGDLYVQDALVYRLN